MTKKGGRCYPATRVNLPNICVFYLPLHYFIAAMPDDLQEEIKEKVIAALSDAGKCTPENMERAMSYKIYDLGRGGR